MSSAAKNCHCGRYIPASRRKAGLDECEACEKQAKIEATRYEKLNELIDAVDAQREAKR